MKLKSSMITKESTLFTDGNGNVLVRNNKEDTTIYGLGFDFSQISRITMMNDAIKNLLKVDGGLNEILQNTASTDIRLEQVCGPNSYTFGVPTKVIKDFCQILDKDSGAYYAQGLLVSVRPGSDPFIAATDSCILAHMVCSGFPKSDKRVCAYIPVQALSKFLRYSSASTVRITIDQDAGRYQLGGDIIMTGKYIHGSEFPMDVIMNDTQRSDEETMLVFTNHFLVQMATKKCVGVGTFWFASKYLSIIRKFVGNSARVTNLRDTNVFEFVELDNDTYAYGFRLFCCGTIESSGT